MDLMFYGWTKFIRKVVSFKENNSEEMTYSSPKVIMDILLENCVFQPQELQMYWKSTNLKLSLETH
jgi:hypothetical protein